MNVLDGPSFGDEEGNIFLEMVSSVTKPGRDRGYYRAVREKKIEKRADEARKADLTVNQPGRYSKTSPFSKDLTHRIRKSLKGGRSISPRRIMMEAA